MEQNDTTVGKNEPQSGNSCRIVYVQEEQQGKRTRLMLY